MTKIHTFEIEKSKLQKHDSLDYWVMMRLTQNFGYEEYELKSVSLCSIDVDKFMVTVLVQEIG